jgi:hypothetical protein
MTARALLQNGDYNNDCEFGKPENVLTHAAKAIEIEDIEARVAALEQAARKREVRAMKTIGMRLSKLEERLGICETYVTALSRLTPRISSCMAGITSSCSCRTVQVLQLYQCRRVPLRSFGLTTLRFLRHVY